MAIGDLDGDLDLDLAVANRASRDVSILLNDPLIIGDSDGDGVLDVCDVCPGFDDFADADGDGVADGCDLCPGFHDLIDSDGDGVPDGCDNFFLKGHQKISDTAGEFMGTLDDDDIFGWSTAALGDLDGDGVGDLAVGAPFDSDMGLHRGAVWILFLNADGTVKSHQKINDTKGGFTGMLDNDDVFGVSVAWLGDLDGDGESVGALAVGAQSDDDAGGGGGFDRGAVWILFLNGPSSLSE